MRAGAKKTANADKAGKEDVFDITDETWLRGRARISEREDGDEGGGENRTLVKRED